MKPSGFSQHQIIWILKEFYPGQKVSNACRQHGISQSTYYQWKSKYGGFETAELQRIKELEANTCWEKMYADRGVVDDALKGAMARKL